MQKSNWKNWKNETEKLREKNANGNHWNISNRSNVHFMEYVKVQNVDMNFHIEYVDKRTQ